MNDIVLASKGYVDGKDCKEYMDIAFNSDMYTKTPGGLMPIISRDDTNIWIIPGETLELTHVMLHYFKSTKDFDNVYIGICPSYSFTSGIPWAVTEIPLQITAGEVIMDIWLKLTTPFRISNETEGWTGKMSGVTAPEKNGSICVLEKTTDGYKVPDGFKKGDSTCQYWNLKTYNDPETIFITNGTKHSPGGEMRGRFYTCAGLYSTYITMQSLRYKIYKNSNNPAALASKEYTDTKMG